MSLIPSTHEGAVYMMAKWRPEISNFDLLYGGHTGSMFNRFHEKQHHKIDRALYAGATHLLVHFRSGSDAEREVIEADLLNSYDLPLNERRATADALAALAELTGAGNDLNSMDSIIRRAAASLTPSATPLPPPSPTRNLAQQRYTQAMARALRGY